MPNMHHLLASMAFVPFTGACAVGRFLRRVKRFSVEMEHGDLSVWVHSNNSGSMLGLLRQQSPMLASPANNPKRKLQWTQEAMWFGNPSLCPLLSKGEPEYTAIEKNAQSNEGFWVGVNTSIPNKMIEIAFHAGALSWTQGYTSLAREKSRQDKQSSDEKTSQTQDDSKNKSEKASISRPISRFDAKLEGPNLPTLWVECKNVTMVEDDVACFPDAVTERGAKHLREMMRIVQEGERAAMFYLVQRPDGHCFGPADFVDPTYAALFYEAMDAGVEMYAYRGVVTREGVALGAPLSIKKPSC